MRIAMRAISASVAAIIAAFAASCVKPATGPDSRTMEQTVLEEWIALHAPAALPLTEGVWYEILETAPEGAAKINGGNWLMAEYDIKDLSGNAAYTRNEETARRLGTFTEYTRYVPDMIFLGTRPASSTIPAAMFYALQEMKVGDVWRVYAASKYIFDSKGIDNVVGYGGQYNLKPNSPAVIDNLKVTELIYDPDQRERNLVNQLIGGAAPEGWDMEPSDSLKQHFYLQRLNSENRGREVPVGSTVKIYYKAKFLDGGFLDSNIDSVWTNRFGDLRYIHNSQTGLSTAVEDTEPISITRKRPAEVFTDMPRKVFGFLMEKDGIRYGDSLRMVVTSPYAYGDIGRVGYVGYTSAYNFNPGYYSQGGYSSESFGRSFYDSSNASFYQFYNTPQSSSVRYPVPEVKYFTPIIYEFVVKE